MDSLQLQTKHQHLVFYFQVHQPRRLKKLQFFDIGSHPDYFDDELNERIINRVATQCYLPANAILLSLIKKHPSIKICFSISGVTLDQFEQYTPEVIDSFRALAKTGSVEFLSETNYHSLASILSVEEFQIQILEHAEKIQHHFGMRPTVFRNTELIYNDEIGTKAAKMGFTGMIVDGVERTLQNKSLYELYTHPEETDLHLLLRNNRLSDDIAFRFETAPGNKKLTAEMYVNWLYALPVHERAIVIGLDYETFGEHQKTESGILNFLKETLLRIVADDKIILSTPSEVFQSVKTYSPLYIPETISWADEQKDITAWLGNDIQKDAFQSLKELEQPVKESSDSKLLEIWRNLQTSDHFYYMSTKKLNDGNIHSYFSHYPSPYEAFINYMNTLRDFTLLVKEAPKQNNVDETVKLREYERQHVSNPIWVEQYRTNHRLPSYINR